MRNGFSTFFARKLSSGALQLAVIISFIVVVLCSLFIMQLYLSSRIVDQGQRSVQQTHSVSSAITATIAKLSLSPSQSVFVWNTDSVEVRVINWGLLTMIQAQTQGAYPIKQAYILGVTPDTAVSLYVCDDEQYVGISGAAQIGAKAYVPRLGLRPEYIGNKGFSGSYKKTEKSSKELPSWTHTPLQQIEQLYAMLNRPLGYSQEFKDSVCQSFFDSTLVIENPEYYGRYIRGNIMLISNKSIELTHAHNCKDVICIAPYIRIKSGFKGAVQLFATDSIVIDSDVILENPSVVCVYNQNMNPQQIAKVVLSDRSIVVGTIFFKAPEMYKNYSRIEIQNGATVYGTVISHNYVENYGTVNGSVYTKNLFAKNSRGVYRNLIIDGSIQPIAEPEIFLSLMQNETVQQWKRVKKMY